MSTISVAILAKNEEKKIKDCIASVSWADKIIVIDDNSVDRTVEIAQGCGAEVFTHTLTSFSQQRNFALSKITTDWVLFLDADERVTEALAKEIKKAIESPHFNGYYIPRKNKIFGKWIEQTDWYPDYQLHLFRKGKGRYQRRVHEQVVVEGKVGKLREPIMHYNYEHVDQFLYKNIFVYADLEVKVLLERGYAFKWQDLIRKPAGEFLRRFFMCEGYKDGVHGLILSLLMAVHTLIVYVKVWEREGFGQSKGDEKFLLDFGRVTKAVMKDFKHWIYTAMTTYRKGFLGKTLVRIRKRLPEV